MKSGDGMRDGEWRHASSYVLYVHTTMYVVQARRGALSSCIVS